MVDIVERKDLTTIGQGIMLGHAIAHELGHLLMPERTHSLAGIMSTRWDRRHWDDAVAGRLLFKKRRRKQCAPICSPDSAEAVTEVRATGAGMLESLPSSTGASIETRALAAGRKNFQRGA